MFQVSKTSYRAAGSLSINGISDLSHYGGMTRVGISARISDRRVQASRLQKKRFTGNVDQLLSSAGILEKLNIGASYACTHIVKPVSVAEVQGDIVSTRRHLCG
jgi:hypothetical protein